MSDTKFFIRDNQPNKAPSAQFWLGWDVGQAQDYSALSILQQEGERFTIKYLERLPLDQPYPAQLETVFRLWHRPPLNKANKTLAIDYTGVGRPVFDLAQDRGLNPIGISITGGDTASWQDDRTRARVPKRDLISAMQIAAQNDLLKVAQGLKFGPVLADELQTFKVKIDPRTAHDSYSAGRVGEHDDLILSVAVALWTAMHLRESESLVVRMISVGGRGRRTI